jgi:hypothetical protein
VEERPGREVGPWEKNKVKLEPPEREVDQEEKIK